MSCEKAMNEALLLLAHHSSSDARLVMMYLDGLTYEEMAKKALAHDENADVKGLAATIADRFNRPRTGSMAKFKVLLERCIAKHGWD